MNIYANFNHFNNQEIENFEEGDVIDFTKAYRLVVECYNDEIFISKLEQFLKIDNISKITNIVIGAWNTDDQLMIQPILDMLIDKKDLLQHIKGFFFGDISIDENEASWIEQGNYEAFLKSFPNIEILHIKGGNGLTFKSIDHENLKELKIISAGLPPNVFAEISQAKLPNLEIIELWLGSDCHGFESSSKDVLEIVSGDKLPKLKHLGLINSEITNELAEELVGHPILNRIESLDLSLGIISDIGANFLFENPSIEKLKKLKIEHHYISDKWIEKLNTLNINVSLSDKQDDSGDEDDRYIALGE